MRRAKGIPAAGWLYGQSFNGRSELTASLERSIEAGQAARKQCEAVGSEVLKAESPDAGTSRAFQNRQQITRIDISGGGQHTMSLRIIRSTEPVPVEHPIFLIYGQPGLGKSSIAFSADEPILLNFDSESALARTVNRRDALNVLTIETLTALQADQVEVLAPFHTVIIDTVGCCVNLMAAKLIHETPKFGQADGTLTTKGWGALKTAFSRWMTDLKALGKTVVFVAHQKEDKNNDVVFMRPDISGGSKDEVLRLADFVGYFYMSGKKRTLDFNPTEQWFGKNPAQWDAWPVPAVAKATDFLAKLIVDGCGKIGKISEVSATIAQRVELWREIIQKASTAEQLNKLLADYRGLPPILEPQVRTLIRNRAQELAIDYDTAKKVFLEPEKEVVLVGGGVL